MVTRWLAGGLRERLERERWVREAEQWRALERGKAELAAEWQRQRQDEIDAMNEWVHRERVALAMAMFEEWGIEFRAFGWSRKGVR